MDDTVGIRLIAYDEASGTIRRVGGALGALGALGRGSGALGQLGGILGRGLSNATANLERYAIRLGFLVAGAGAKAVSWAVDFQKNMLLLQTQTGASAQEVADMTKGVMSLVSQTATAPIDLAKMLYHIESVGVRGSQALDLLRVSALGVKIGIVDDQEAVTNAMAAIKFSGIQGVTSFSQSMAVLDAIVGTGNMRMQDLAHSFSTGVLGTAKTFGVSLQSLGAALAVLTDAGVPPQQAMYRLSYMFTLLAAPTKNAQKFLKSIGLAQFGLAADMRKPDGIFKAVDDLRQHMADAGLIDAKGKVTKQGAGLVARAFGGGRFSSTLLQLLGMSDRIPQKYALIMRLQDQFDQRVKETQATWAYQFSQLQANITAIGTKIGDAIAPGLAKVNSVLNSWIAGNQPAIDKFISDLGSGFSSFVDKMMAVDWGSVANGLKAAANFAVGLIDAFMSAPDWVKGLLVSGFALNKLTGGMVTDLAGWGIKNGAGLLANLASRIPGPVGSLISNIEAVPVRVVNWPSGFGTGLPGGGPGGGGGGGGPEIAPGGLLAPGLGTLLGMIAGVFAMDYLIPMAFKGRSGSTDRTPVTRDIGGRPFTYDNSYGAIPNWSNLANQAIRLGATTYVAGESVAHRTFMRNQQKYLTPEERHQAAINAALPSPRQLPRDEGVKLAPESQNELVQMHLLADQNRQKQAETKQATDNVRETLHMDLSTMQVQLAEMVAKMQGLLEKDWSVTVSPQAVGASHAVTRVYGNSRDGQRSQITGYTRYAGKIVPLGG